MAENCFLCHLLNWDPFWVYKVSLMCFVLCGIITKKTVMIMYMKFEYFIFCTYTKFLVSAYKYYCVHL